MWALFNLEIIKTLTSQLGGLNDHQLNLGLCENPYKKKSRGGQKTHELHKWVISEWPSKTPTHKNHAKSSSFSDFYSLITYSNILA